MEEKKNQVRVIAAVEQKASDEMALRKVARAVISIAARQIEREAEEQPTGEEGDAS
ncbi:hypothetical protein ABCS02_14080 [Microbacterium sp. X-17]|uniref:hypothetical protein n=1 Tax=Microbacterium sp. X-17 TaxID=3144404 RepID=UPI0031F4A10D